MSLNTLDKTVEKILPAKISWQKDELGNIVPKSDIFNDVYYSVTDGLNESRYVFIKHNHLNERFKTLLTPTETPNGTNPYRNFTIVELGFGTGLNVLLTWQLWQDTKRKIANELSVNSRTFRNIEQQPVPHLHIISTEKYPLSYNDLSRSLMTWQKQDASLSPLIEQLLALYPPLVAGCHRLHLAADITLDMWFGDAPTSLLALDTINNAYVDAWYLDGFAPSCNEALWTGQIFHHMQRLSRVGTTASTFSCAGVVKRGLTDVGFDIKKVKGFGQKKHMLMAKLATDNEATNHETTTNQTTNNEASNAKPSSTHHCNIKRCSVQSTHKTLLLPLIYHHVAIIGAGVSGLMAAWTLAKRGIKVTLCDKTAPLSGASGNPRALLAPKMTPIAHVAEHLHTISYLYSGRLYQQLDKEFDSLTSVFEPTTAVDLLLKANVNTSQIKDYPVSIASVLTSKEAKELTGLDEQNLEENLYLPKAGLINPQALAHIILNHPNITYKRATVTKITVSTTTQQEVKLTLNTVDDNNAVIDNNTNADRTALTSSILADAVIIAAAFESQSLDAKIFGCRKIRGQLSWFTPTAKQLAALPKVPLKYGGYCALFEPSSNDATLNPVIAHTPTFLLGASFIRNDLSVDIRHNEHEVNLHKLVTAVPELKTTFSANEGFESWQARVGIRAQTPDYHPMVGQVDQAGLIWTLSGMGSKGFAFAPLCAETLADMMMGRFTPLSTTMLNRLSPHRKSLQTSLS